jgi:hypothetical protein
MDIRSMPMAFCSRVAFPAFYQSLFTYFLLLATLGSNYRQEAIIVLAIVGIPLTARVNFLLVRERNKRLSRWLFSNAWMVTMILPIFQVLFAVFVS